MAADIGTKKEGVKKCKSVLGSRRRGRTGGKSHHSGKSVGRGNGHPVRGETATRILVRGAMGRGPEGSPEQGRPGSTTGKRSLMNIRGEFRRQWEEQRPVWVLRKQAMGAGEKSPFGI